MNKYPCDNCNKNFSSEKTLETHKNKYHCLKIDISKSIQSNQLSMSNQILKFNDNIIKYFIHDNNLYFKAKDIAKILKYVDTKDAIKRHILNQDKFIVSNLLGGGFSPPLDDNNKKILEKDDSKTIYINESGLYSLFQLLYFYKIISLPQSQLMI